MGEPEDWEVIVVGGGFCGCWALKALRDKGFKVRMYEWGSALGGIWYWNAYPGARVDTPTPTYQLTAKETWETWEWKEKFPSRDELGRYFRHLDRVWDLSKDITYNTRVTSMQWDAQQSRWLCELNGGASVVKAWTVVLCTGFASKLYIPPYRNLESFKGQTVHTSLWPQKGFNLDNKKVAVIGTGATGVQAIQEIAQVASKLTVFQRTPNTALPMTNPNEDAKSNKAMRDRFPETAEKMKNTFAGFDYQFDFTKPEEISKEDRFKFYEKLFHMGGLQFWLGTYMDTLYKDEWNEEIYQFWRSKTLPRIKDKRNQEILAPEKKIDPFGTKRISLEAGFFECFNQDNVELVDLRSNQIKEFVPEGIKTMDEKVHEFDVVVFATGFDSITGGITQIEILGTDGKTVEEKWKGGTYTQLGMTTSKFPNLFFTYGPQAPTAFATGPSSAETQGGWIVECIQHMRDNNYSTIEATREAEEEWRKHTNEVANTSLFPQANSW